MTTYATPGDLLRSLRARHGLDQKGLAERAGVPAITIYFIESGRTRSPKIETLHRLAQSVGEPVTSLLAVVPQSSAGSREATRTARAAGPKSSRLAKLNRELRRLEAQVRKTSEARRLLPPGSSRARVTTANARWASACEARDRVLRQIEELTQQQ